MWTILFTKNAQKDKKQVKEAGLEKKVKFLLAVLTENPYSSFPSYEKLIGDLKGYYSRRINIQHRLAYRIDEEKRLVIVHSMWTHYEK